MHVPGRVQVIDVLLAVVLRRIAVQRTAGRGERGVPRGDSGQVVVFPAVPVVVQLVHVPGRVQVVDVLLAVVLGCVAVQRAACGCRERGRVRQHGQVVVQPVGAVVVQLVHVPGQIQVVDVLLAVVLGRVPIQRAGRCGQVGSSVRAQRQVVLLPGAVVVQLVHVPGRVDEIDVLLAVVVALVSVQCPAGQSFRQAGRLSCQQDGQRGQVVVPPVAAVVVQLVRVARGVEEVDVLLAVVLGRVPVKRAARTCGRRRAERDLAQVVVLPAAAVVVQLVHVPGRVQVVHVLLAVELGRVPVQRPARSGGRRGAGRDRGQVVVPPVAAVVVQLVHVARCVQVIDVLLTVELGLVAVQRAASHGLRWAALRDSGQVVVFPAVPVVVELVHVPGRV